MLMMLVINKLMCPEILLVYYDAASIRQPNVCLIPFSVKKKDHGDKKKT